MVRYYMLLASRAVSRYTIYGNATASFDSVCVLLFAFEDCIQ
jgi:hypothetical protein